MNLPCPVWVLYSDDGALIQRMHGFLDASATVQVVADDGALDLALERQPSALVMLDVMAPASREVLKALQENHPQTLVVMFAPSGSQAAVAGADAGVYAVESPDIGRLQCQALSRRAQEHARLLRENVMLRGAATAQVMEPSASLSPVTVTGGGIEMSSLRSFSHATRHYADVDSVAEHMVEAVASFAKTFRVGMFVWDGRREEYRLRCGIRCMSGTSELQIGERDVIARWLAVHAHIVARSQLPNCVNLEEREVLRQALDLFGAELIVPLHGTERLVGWLLVGKRITGGGYSAAEIENFMPLADHVSSALETALLSEEVTIQKTLGETVLSAIPIGVVAVDHEGQVRWYNRAAEAILERPSEHVLHASVSRIGGPLGNMVLRALEGVGTEECHDEFVDPMTCRLLSVTASRLVTGDRCLGAVAIVNDRTQELALRSREERAERATFWAELATAISHEVRNPLVAIKTYAQLLPERYDDPEFRSEFSEMTNTEVGRLDAVIDQIHAFANPPPLVFEMLQLDEVLRRAIELARETMEASAATIRLEAASGDLCMEGDERALVECFSNIIINSLEAVDSVGDAKIEIVCGERPKRREGDPRRLFVTFTDQGAGIAPELVDKVFSPFSTTKSRGIGLGLPVAKRTVLDHDGQIAVSSGPRGAQVDIVFSAVRGRNG
jgi:nitrogen-specific signal transduction histidine kinase/DNA-binding response OmpR family regulator